MTISVSLINMKGGVGKTTLAFNLAWYSAYKQNLRVLVVDLDPQSNVSQYLMGARDYLDYINSQNITLVNVLESFAPASGVKGSPYKFEPEEAVVDIRNWRDNSCIHLVPSRLELVRVLQNPSAVDDRGLALFLSQLDNGYDLVIIDCAPTESLLTQLAYRASSKILVPVKPEFLAAIGLPLLASSLEKHKLEHKDQKLDMAGIVFNDGDPQNIKPEHRQGREDVEALCKQHKWRILKNEVRHSDSYPRGARQAKPISNTPYARWWVKSEFENFGKEFLKLVGKA